MTIKNPRKTRKKLVAAFAAAAAVFSSSAAASERYDLTNGKKNVTVYELNQSEAKGLIADYHRAVREEGLENNYLERIVFIAKKVRDDARAQGFSEIEARAIAERMAYSYTIFPISSTHGLLFDENSPLPFNGMTPSASSFGVPVSQVDGEYRWVCSIAALGEGYSMQDFLRGYTSLGQRIFPQLPGIYSDMFRDHVNFHEKTHCLQSPLSENGADYIAALQLLHKYRDRPEDVRQFLALVTGLRNYVSAYTAKTDNYTLTGAYIQLAVADYDADPARFSSEQAIWNLHGEGGVPSRERALAADDQTFLPYLEYLENVLRINICRAPGEAHTPAVEGLSPPTVTCEALKPFRR